MSYFLCKAAPRKERRKPPRCKNSSNLSSRLVLLGFDAFPIRSQRLSEIFAEQGSVLRAHASDAPANEVAFLSLVFLEPLVAHWSDFDRYHRRWQAENDLQLRAGAKKLSVPFVNARHDKRQACLADVAGVADQGRYGLRALGR